MVWNPDLDQLRLKVNRHIDHLKENPTKADIVSNISTVYDPSGVFGPTVLIGKLIMQDFWREPNIGWKDQAPLHLVQRWRSYMEEVKLMTTIPINRWTFTSPSDQMHWHIFTDASEKAYGAAAYIRTVKPNGKVHITLVATKSRVAPIKTQSIPRLELFGAVLGSKLLAYVEEATNIKNIPITMWTDSAIVVNWINKDLSRMSAYVGTRIAQILETTRKDDWQHVSSKDNPADILSRGMPALQLEKSQLWWRGPAWLGQQPSDWPKSRINLSPQEIEADIKETKKQAPRALVVTNNTLADKELSVLNQDGDLESLLSRRSTLNGVLRVTAYVLRFIKCIRESIQEKRQKLAALPLVIGKPSTVTPQERDEALLQWVHIVQRTSFPKEIEALSVSNPLPKGSRLVKLVPHWFSEDSTLRLAGRVEYSHLPHDEKHQMILPADHRLVLLLIRQAHIRTIHGGPQLCIANLRQRWWILNVRRQVQKYIHKSCTQCIRFSKTTANQIMAPLPSSRVTPGEPFSRVGVDFAGPFTLRKNQSTAMALRKAVTSIPKEPATVKGWVVVFVCLITRAVHLDVVRGLNVEAFLECLARLQARRGMVAEIWSDNGTTFVGTDNELKRVFEGWNNKLPEQQLGELGISWKFITPGAPFQGGIWEAGVKTFKHHFKRIIGSRMLTADQLYTIVVQIEGVMNARPLFPQSDDPSDLNPITPAHLVIGRSTLQRPLTEKVDEIPDNRLTIWGLQQKILQQFWNTWRSEYITS